MAHEFDTGLVLPQRRKVREAIARRLREELGVASLPLAQGDQYFKDVVELAAPFEVGDPDLEEMLKEAAAGRSPIAAVALGGRTFEASNSDERQWRGNLSVYVYVVSSHRGGLLTRMRGGDHASTTDQTVDPGIETALEHVFERLAGYVPPDCLAAELRPRSEGFPYVADDYTVAELAFDLALQTDVNAARKRLRVVTTILTTHDESAADVELEAISELEASS